MNHFIDFEFLEGDVPVKILGVNIPKWLIEPNNTIQPISVGIVTEDGRELYLISKEFNLKEAWNRYDVKVEIMSGDMRNRYPEGRKTKVYWIRENVLKPIHYELSIKEAKHKLDYINWCKLIELKDGYSNRHYKTFKKLINKYGKTNKEIAENILWFCAAEKSIFETDGLGQEVRNRLEDNPVKFYGYYADYDWVCFCWLFGKMIDLPTGFPMLMFDIQQLIVENNIDKKNLLKEVPQINCHNSLQDAIWNKNAFNWIQNIIYNGKQR